MKRGGNRSSIPPSSCRTKSPSPAALSTLHPRLLSHPLPSCSCSPPQDSPRTCFVSEYDTTRSACSSSRPSWIRPSSTRADRRRQHSPTAAEHLDKVDDEPPHTGMRRGGDDVAPMGGGETPLGTAGEANRAPLAAVAVASAPGDWWGVGVGWQSAAAARCPARSGAASRQSISPTTIAVLAQSPRPARVARSGSEDEAGWANTPVLRRRRQEVYLGLQEGLCVAQKWIPGRRGEGGRYAPV